MLFWRQISLNFCTAEREIAYMRHAHVAYTTNSAESARFFEEFDAAKLGGSSR